MKNNFAEKSCVHYGVLVVKRDTMLQLKRMVITLNKASVVFGLPLVTAAFVACIMLRCSCGYWVHIIQDNIKNPGQAVIVDESGQ